MPESRGRRGACTRRALLAALLTSTAFVPGRAAARDESASLTPGPPPSSPPRGRGDDGPPVGPDWPRHEWREARSTGGATIRYLHTGRGDVTVVCVHGWSCNHRFFGPQLAPLARSHRVLAVDLAGHGRSGMRVGPTSVDAFADDVAAVVRREVRGPCVLLVHSTGGRVACALAPRLDDRLRAIVGIDTFQNLARGVPEESVIAARLAAQRADFVGDTRRYVSTFFQPGADPALVRWVERQMLAVDPAAAIAATEAFARFDGRTAIAGWPRPVIALNSDWVPTDRRRIREVLPRFDLLVLPGRGHFPNLDDPDAFGPVLLATLDRVLAVR